MVRRFASVLSVIVALLITSSSFAQPGDPPPGSLEWRVRDAQNQLDATGRLQDEYANPAMAANFWSQTPGSFITGNVQDQATQPDRPMVSLGQWIPGGTTADPYRQTWAPERGVVESIEYYSRTRARITGHVWRPKASFVDPLTGDSPTTFPGVVITTGSIQGYEELYWWAAQGLAEAGYVVMTYDVQGQGQSETFGHRPDGSLWCGSDGCPQVPFQQDVNFFDGTRDALDWFLSPANPMLSYVDTSRLALAGHSLGATAITQIGNTDPRIDAVVAWDNASRGNVAPRVPTMGQNADYFFNPQPMQSPPNADSKGATFRDFRSAEIPSMQVALRGSTHLEWTYVPYILPASKQGERVAMYYTLAWLDRWLKGSIWNASSKTESIVSSAYVSDATRRLTAITFDDSADRSAIGAGSWDAMTNTNVPHTLNGESIADNLSFYYRSAYWLNSGTRCDDMREAC